MCRTESASEIVLCELAILMTQIKLELESIFDVATGFNVFILNMAVPELNIFSFRETLILIARETS